jgi:hypothetical protein
VEGEVVGGVPGRERDRGERETGERDRGERGRRGGETGREV